MAFNRLEVNDLATAALDDSDQVIVGESNTYKKATVSALKNNILGASPSYTTDTEPYLMRQTAHVGVVGKCALNKLVGGSLGWNQLNNYGQNSGTNNGVTYTKTANGWAVSGTATSPNQSQYRTTTDIPCVSGHRYLCIANAVLSTNGLYIIIWRNNSATRAASIGQNAAESFVMFTGGSDWTNLNIWFHVPSGKTASNTNLVVNLIDLTAEFGSTIAEYIYSIESATAGAGVAWLSKYIDLGTYHAYDAGSIQSVQATAHVTTGKNLLENTTATQTINGITFTRNADGSVTANGTATANAQYTIDIDTSKIYGNLYFNGVSGGSFSTYQIYMWDSTDGGRAKKWNGTTNSDDSVNLTTLQEVKVPQGHTVTLVCRVVSGTTVSNVRFYPMLTYPSNTDPTYEPYTAHIYPLGSDTLRGYPMLVNNKLAFDGDEKYPNGTTKRKYGIVDLGTLPWKKYNVAEGTLFRASIDTIKRTNAPTDVPNIICSHYPVKAQSERAEKTISQPTNNSAIDIIDSAYTDATAFKTAMSGVYLVYPLETPTTESSTAYQKVQTIDADGTESFTTSSPVPVGHETQTPDNILAALSWVGE